MTPHAAALDWVETQQPRMLRLVRDWAAINSHSYNIKGLAQFSDALAEAFGKLGGQLRLVELPANEIVDPRGRVRTRPLGRAIVIQKRPTAPRRVLLCIHMDTVYPPASSFAVQMLDASRMRGPGVADAKGGLAVMLVALEALEQSSLAESLGWDVIINPDEELGSHGSSSLLRDAANRNHMALLFEPADEHGTMISQRRGSVTVSAVVHGRSAHAGRDPQEGRNAIVAMTDVIHAADELNRTISGLTVNVGRIEGGSAANVVPDLAVCQINARFESVAEQRMFHVELKRVADQINAREGFHIELHGALGRPPKPQDQRATKLMEHITACGKELGLDVKWKATGGVSDGNTLAAAGLPNIDSMGVRGGHIHSENEYLMVDSLSERAQLTTLFLLKLAAGEIPLP